MKRAFALPILLLTLCPGAAAQRAIPIPDGGFGDARGGGVYLFTLSACSTHVPLPIPDDSPAGVTSTVFIPDFAGVVGDIDILFNITHTCVQDLEISLIAPDGTTVLVIDSVVDNGILVGRPGIPCDQNFTDTVVDDEAATNLRSGVAPWTGAFNTTWSGAAPLSTVDGRRFRGAWTLRVRDENEQDVGTLNFWCLQIQALPDLCPGDITGDGLVNSDDLSQLLGNWGGCPVFATGGVDGP